MEFELVDESSVIGKIYELPILNCVSLVLILGSALLISGAVVYSSITALREKNQTASPTVE
jgi:hypothetical protein